MAVGHACIVEVNLGSLFFAKIRANRISAVLSSKLFFFAICNQVAKSSVLQLINFSTATGNSQANGGLGQANGSAVQLVLFRAHFVTFCCPRQYNFES